jgi:hypothetical protein
VPNDLSRQRGHLLYAHSANPPVLHRKETFLPPDHPLHARFARLTRQEEEHGLLTDTATIGTRAGWQARLRAVGWAGPARPPPRPLTLRLAAADQCGPQSTPALV